ncbi:hypothetical protein HHK36_026863 [Tetracentron sinense]|uniref:Agenet domain-containing protein n=1 Tax=Tetracentron sinense TaxID=13715 RepID=A0A834YGB9_TETSI|nr:hypothetical protein HHK36_026863 [Tetracentron sinense]
MVIRDPKKKKKSTEICLQEVAGQPGPESQEKDRQVGGRLSYLLFDGLTMDMNCHPPFKVGQQAESKSFISGFRGAWFRCKIKDIGMRKGNFGLALEFFDFPDEKIKWTQLYQKSPSDRRSREAKLQLMVRPCFPPIYCKNQMPDISTISEVIAIVDNAWKVGDLVDWWTDNCYWSGRVTHLLGNDKVKIKLPEPPLGEGLTYDVFCKDLRPSLEWSSENGWTVPVSTDEKSCCARLIQPVNQDNGRENGHATGGAPCEYSASVSSLSSSVSLPPPDRSEHPPTKEKAKQPSCSNYSMEETQMPNANMDLNMGDSGMVNASCSDNVLNSHSRDASVATGRDTARKDRYSYSGSSKKMKINGDISLNSMCSDTIESAILDLEELANRIKWMKGILQFEISYSNAMRPPWKFLENRASFTPR